MSEEAGAPAADPAMEASAAAMPGPTTRSSGAGEPAAGSEVRVALGALAGFVAAAVVLTWPLAARLGSQVAGARGDLWIHQWNLWWIDHALREGLDLFVTDRMFHPGPVSLAFHNFPWLHAGAWMPLRPLLGPVAAYDVVFLAAMALNGFGLYVLAREHGLETGPAWIGGLVLLSRPYFLSHAHHPNLIFVGLVPLAMVAIRRLLLGGGTRDLVATAALLAGVALARWQLAWMAAVPIGLYLLACLARHPEARGPRRLGALAGATALALAVVSPLAWPLVRAMAERGGDLAEVQIDLQSDRPTDLAAWFLPAPDHALWGAAMEPLYDERMPSHAISTATLGYLTLLLAALGCARRWKAARLWAAMGGVLALLALGPVLRVLGQDHPGVPMPYRLTGDLFLVLREPDRFNAVLGIPLAMLAAFGAAALARRGAPVLAVVAVALVLESAVWPFPTSDARVPAWYTALAAGPEDFAVLDLPMYSRGYDKRYLQYQTVHGKAMVGGHVSRSEDAHYAFLDSLSLFSERKRRYEIRPRLPDTSGSLRELHEANVRYVVLHKEMGRDRLVERDRRALAIPPVHEDEDLVVYATDPAAWPPIEARAELAPGLGVVDGRCREARGAGGGGDVELEVVWKVDRLPDPGWQLCLEPVHAIATPLPAEVTRDSTWPPLACVRLAVPARPWDAPGIRRETYAFDTSTWGDGDGPGLWLTIAGATGRRDLGEDLDLAACDGAGGPDA